MRCKIADLFVEVPAAGGMEQRCGAYITDSDQPADITILESEYMPRPLAQLGYDDGCYIGK